MRIMSDVGASRWVEENITTGRLAPKSFVKAPYPVIAGSATTSKRVAVIVGTWDLGASLKVQWLKDGLPIAGATGSTFLIPRTFKGHALSVRVTGQKSGYLTLTRTSSKLKITK